MVVERLRLVAVDVINNLANGIINAFRVVGDVMACHVSPGVPKAKGDSFSWYLKLCTDRGECITSGVHREVVNNRLVSGGRSARPVCALDNLPRAYLLESFAPMAVIMAV